MWIYHSTNSLPPTPCYKLAVHTTSLYADNCVLQVKRHNTVKRSVGRANKICIRPLKKQWKYSYILLVLVYLLCHIWNYYIPHKWIFSRADCLIRRWLACTIHLHFGEWLLIILSVFYRSKLKNSLFNFSYHPLSRFRQNFKWTVNLSDELWRQQKIECRRN